MTPPVQPTQPPNVELELAKLANDAMANGADPHDVTTKLHQTISYLRQFPKMAEHATNALTDGVASPADISRTLWPHVEAMSHANGPNVSNAPTPDEAAQLPGDVTPRSRFGGGLAAFDSGIPGGELLTTGVHALVTRQPWDQSLKDVRAAEASSPIRVPLKIAGAVTAMKPIPGSVPLQAARYGLAQEVATPDKTPLDQRLKRGAGRAVVDAATAGMLNKVFTVARGFFSPSASEGVVANNNAIASADEINYPQAVNEGRATLAQQPHLAPQVDAALNAKGVKPYADQIRNSLAYENADAPEQVQETYKLMTREQQRLQSVPPHEFDAAKQLELKNLGIAKQRLLAAIDPIMPSFRGAVETHAAGEAQNEARGYGSDAARAMIRNTDVAGNRLGSKSREAYIDAASKLPPDKARIALQGALGRVGRDVGVSPHVTEGFGLFPSLRAGRAAPVVNALDKQAGNLTPDLLRRLGVASTDEAYQNLFPPDPRTP